MEGPGAVARGKSVQPIGGGPVRRALFATVPALAGLLVALLLGALVVLLAGRSPGQVALHLARDFGGTDLGDTLYYTTVFVFTGLSVGYAFQAGLFNIGGEGQLVAGGFVMALVGAALPAGTPGILAFPVCLAAGFAAGGACAAVPAVLRVRFGAHEVITTILMNIIVSGIASFGLGLYRSAHKELAEATHTLPVAPGARVAPLDTLMSSLEGSHANTLIFLAIVVTLIAWYAVNHTRGGFELRAVGLNAEAAQAQGISVNVVITKALLVSGGLCGLAAAPFVLSNNYYYEQDMLAGSGFMGIAVAVLAGNDPLRILLSAFLMAFLTQAGEVVNGSKTDEVPKEIVLVLQAVVIVSVLVAQGIARSLVQKAQARRASRAE